MTTSSKNPQVPAERVHTTRQAIMDALSRDSLSVKGLSAIAGIPEKDVYSHLEHIERTLQASGHRLVITPARCRKCGFVFRKRQRYAKPGKCPVCKGSTIEEPRFRIE